MQINVYLLFGFIILILSIVIALRSLFNINEKKDLNNKNDKSKKNEYDLIIVGAGLSGLTSAYEANKLTNNSLKILVIEASPNYGGNSINEIDGINILLNEKYDDKKVMRDNFSLFFNDSFEFGQYQGDTDILMILNAII